MARQGSAETGSQDDMKARLSEQGGAGQIDAGDTRQANIGKQNVKTGGRQDAASFFAIARCLRLMTKVFQYFTHQILRIEVVFHYQNLQSAHAKFYR